MENYDAFTVLKSSDSKTNMGRMILTWFSFSASWSATCRKNKRLCW